jgi:hypothetical protein
VAYSIFIFRFVLVQIFLMNSTGNKVALGEIRTAATEMAAEAQLSAAAAAALAAGLSWRPRHCRDGDTPQQHL